MPYAPSQGARIYYEEAGAGTPILFIHEFGGDHRSWDDQMRHFGRSWRCLTWGARGYPPSDCPGEESLYGQDFFNRDAIAVLDAAKIDKAHIVGLSMGGYTALMLAAKYPERVHLLHRRRCGLRRAEGHARAVHRGMPQDRRRVRAHRQDRRGSDGPRPDPRATAQQGPDRLAPFVAHLAEHPATAAAKTLRTVQAGRASLYDLEAELKGIKAPVLLLVGDEDEPCLDVNLWMKRLMPVARLGLLPGSGHAINLEEPALFNQLIEQFIADVERGTWRPRDERAKPGATTSLASARA